MNLKSSSEPAVHAMTVNRLLLRPPKKRITVVRRIEYAFGVPLRANPMGMAFPRVCCRGRIKQADNAETYEPIVQTKIIADANMADLCNRLLKARKFSTVLSEMHLRHCELLQSTVNCSVDLYFRAGLCPRIVLFNKADSLTPFEKIRTREIRTSESFWQRMMLDNKPPGAVTLVFLLPKCCQ